ncbi:hypothetical protein D6D25_06108 [Aureobasidium pullulans]|nr:hypothetical protein D6D25_06108 [Aureobasidium pullulans]
MKTTELEMASHMEILAAFAMVPTRLISLLTGRSSTLRISVTIVSGHTRSLAMKENWRTARSGLRVEEMMDLDILGHTPTEGSYIRSRNIAVMWTLCRFRKQESWI